MSSVVHNQGTILIIQDHAAMSSTFINLLKQTGQPMALRPWLPGTLSNFRVLRQTYLKVFYLKIIFIVNLAWKSKKNFNFF